MAALFPESPTHLGGLGSTRLLTVECQPLVGELVDEAARLVRDAYTDVEQITRRVRLAASNTGFDVQPDELIMRRVGARIPRPGRSTQQNFDVARSELGEVLVAHLLEEHAGVVFPTKKLRHKELVHSPARGTDLIGVRRLDDGTVALVLVEIKVSIDARKPPAVVGPSLSSNDTLAGQLARRLSDSDALHAELLWLDGHVEAAHDEVMAEVLMAYETHQARIDLVPALVRPDGRADAHDYGAYAERELHAGYVVDFHRITTDDHWRIAMWDVYFSARHLL